MAIGLVLLLRRRGSGGLKPAASANVLASSLKNEKLKSDIILNGIEDGILLIDNQKIIQLFNPAAAQITGWPTDEALGLDYHAVVKLVDSKGEAYNDTEDPLNQAFEKNQPVRGSAATLISRSNKRYTVSLSVSPLRDHAGAISGAVAVLRDISQEQDDERRRAEFISTASHEMRTPVAAIEGYLALALNDRVSKIDAKARDYLEKAHTSTQNLGKLFQDLLTSAKAEDGRLSSHPVVVEMGAYLEQLTEDLRFAAEKKGLLSELVVGTSDGVNDTTAGSKVVRPLYYAFVDPDRMREVITNLFDNAVKYTETGKVSIGLTGNSEITQMYIKDTGPGIPAEDIPHLFQKFYRVDNSSTRTVGGTGLGLFICSKIVDLYHGRIWVESELGKGSSFYINLPRLSTQRATELQATETTRSGASQLAT